MRKQQFFLFLLLVLGALLSLTSQSWLHIWMALEVNLFSMVSLMVLDAPWSWWYSAPIYFCWQVIGSWLLFIGIFHGISVLVGGLMVKLGSSPFHSWVLTVFKFSSVWICALLSTWQKVSPLLILAMIPEFSYSFNLILIGVILSGIMGSISSLGVVQFKVIMAGSSIHNMGWMMLSAALDMEIFLVVFFIYLSVLIVLFSELCHSSREMWSPKVSISMILGMLSLMGCPPLVGFLSKFLILLSAPMWPSAFLILGAALGLMIYITMVLQLAMLSKIEWGSWSFYSIFINIGVSIPLLSLV